jgi:hypothetical protein
MENIRLGGHPDLSIRRCIDLQLRHSVGFAPNFPRYLHWLLPSRTEFGLIVYRTSY